MSLSIAFYSDFNCETLQTAVIHPTIIRGDVGSQTRISTDTFRFDYNTLSKQFQVGKLISNQPQTWTYYSPSQLYNCNIIENKPNQNIMDSLYDYLFGKPSKSFKYALSTRDWTPNKSFPNITEAQRGCCHDSKCDVEKIKEPFRNNFKVVHDNNQTNECRYSCNNFDGFCNGTKMSQTQLQLSQSQPSQSQPSQANKLVIDSS
eukprot:Pgem_evm1s4705